MRGCETLSQGEDIRASHRPVGLTPMCADDALRAGATVIHSVQAGPGTESSHAFNAFRPSRPVRPCRIRYLCFRLRLRQIGADVPDPTNRPGPDAVDGRTRTKQTSAPFASVGAS